MKTINIFRIKIALYLFVVLGSAIIIAGICSHYYIQKPKDYFKISRQKYDSLIAFAPYLGKRVAIWGIVVSGEKKFRSYPYVLPFANPKLKMKLNFFYGGNKFDAFLRELNLSSHPFKDFSGRETRKYAYISGVLTYELLNLNTRPSIANMELPYVVEYGEFCLSDPEVIKILPEDKEKDFINTVPYKIELQELTDEDKQLIKTPYLEDAGKRSFLRYLQYLKDGK